MTTVANSIYAACTEVLAMLLPVHFHCDTPRQSGGAASAI